MLRLVTAIVITAGLFHPATQRKKICYFPNKNVEVVKSSYEQPGLSFLVLHDDENTGAETAHAFCDTAGGSIVELQYGNERNITFGYKRTKFSFDPNQMFNNAGAYRTLRKYSVNKPGGEVISMVRALALEVLNAYKPDSLGYIVTLHNNTDERFSIASYQNDPLLKGVADSVFINQETDEDDFILVTEPAFFNYLKARSVNTVLQSEHAKDGSLSVYAQTNKIPYVNIEVQDGHYQEHLRLIQVVNTMFNEIGHGQLYAGRP